MLQRVKEKSETCLPLLQFLPNVRRVKCDEVRVAADDKLLLLGQLSLDPRAAPPAGFIKRIRSFFASWHNPSQNGKSSTG
jgi:hypothetical protein